MRCDEFEDRLNDCLDAGRPPSSDGSLQRHAGECRDCRGTLQAWQSIVCSLHPHASRRSAEWRRAIPWAIAAGLGFVLFATYRPASSVKVASSDPPAVRLSEAPHPSIPLSPPPWEDPAWIDRWADHVAEPLVPLSQGLAPLGRSFQTAFSLLVFPASPGKNNGRSISPPLQSSWSTSFSDGGYA